MGRMTPDPQTLDDVVAWILARAAHATDRATTAPSAGAALFAVQTSMICEELAAGLAAEAPWSPSCDGTPAEHERRG